jgi:hypothetical protein
MGVCCCKDSDDQANAPVRDTQNGAQMPLINTEDTDIEVENVTGETIRRIIT